METAAHTTGSLTSGKEGLSLDAEEPGGSHFSVCDTEPSAGAVTLLLRI